MSVSKMVPGKHNALECVFMPIEVQKGKREIKYVIGAFINLILRILYILPIRNVYLGK